MRKLLLVLALLGGAAHADEWFETPNNAGGKILFLSATCDGTQNGRLVLATTREGNTVRGCWFFFADMVHVVWQGQNGKTSSFDPKTLTYRKNND